MTFEKATNKLREYYTKDLEFENNLLLILFLILTFIFTIWLCVSVKEKGDLKKENAKLHQQVIDYKWQLEQVQYILEHEKGD